MNDISISNVRDIFLIIIDKMLEDKVLKSTIEQDDWLPNNYLELPQFTKYLNAFQSLSNLYLAIDSNK